MDYLLIGNGPSINNIDWGQVQDTTLCKVGINRSYIVFPSHDYLFFQDPIIVQELLDAGYTEPDLFNLNLRTTNYFNTRLLRDRAKGMVTAYEFQELAGFIRSNAVNIVRKFAFHTYAPFTIPNAISYFSHLDQRDFQKPNSSKHYKNTIPITFYIAGCDLKFSQNNNHFWQHKYENQSRLSGAGGSSRKQLNKQYGAFQRVAVRADFLKINIVSVTPKSKLNNLFKYEPITTVLNRYRKRKNNDRKY